MRKEIICVYQDCVLCGMRGKELGKIIYKKKLNVRKVSFASEEGSKLVHEALMEHGIGQMPFFTDGKVFSTDINEVLKKPKKKSKKENVESV